jgi:hypothetical protein
MSRGVVVLVVYLLVTHRGGVRLLVAGPSCEIATFLERLPQYAGIYELAGFGCFGLPGVLDVDLETWIVVNAQLARRAPSLLRNAHVGFATSVLGGFTVLFTVFMALYLTIDAPRMRLPRGVLAG